MCFSAPASFVAAALATGAGAIALTRANGRADAPLAAMPVFFGFQQLLEGFLWLTLPVAPDAAAATTLTSVFLHFALVFWPIYAPMAALLIEPEPVRRRLIALCLLGGIGVSLYFLLSLAETPRTAVIDGGHIVYSADPHLPAPMLLLYPAATCLSLMLSSLAIVRLAGIVIFAGSVIAFAVYWDAFTSVWCFFAAVASGLIVYHFEAVRRGAAESTEPADRS